MPACFRVQITTPSTPKTVATNDAGASPEPNFCNIHLGTARQPMYHSDCKCRHPSNPLGIDYQPPFKKLKRITPSTIKPTRRQNGILRSYHRSNQTYQLSPATSTAREYPIADFPEQSLTKDMILLYAIKHKNILSSNDRIEHSLHIPP